MQAWLVKWKHKIGQVDRTHSDKQLSDGVVCKHLLVCKGYLEGTVLLGPLAGPVLLTLLLAPLQNIGYHGNYGNSLLPHQPPEVSDSFWKGAYTHSEFQS